MDANKLQTIIFNRYSKSILDMDFTELYTALIQIEQEMIEESDYSTYLEMQEEEQARIDREQAEEDWLRQIDEDLQRDIDEYNQMAGDDKEFPL